jgi:hypothetical protein
MKTEKLKIWEIVFKLYLVINTTFGILVCLMNYHVSISFKNDPDPNPGAGLYFLIIGPMIIAFILTMIVSIFQYFKRISTFKISLMPLAIWGLSFIILLIIG